MSCVCVWQYRMLLEVVEMFQYAARQQNACKYRPHDGPLSAKERSLVSLTSSSALPICQSRIFSVAETV